MKVLHQAEVYIRSGGGGAGSLSCQRGTDVANIVARPARSDRRQLLSAGR